MASSNFVVKRFLKRDPLLEPHPVNRWDGPHLRTSYRPRGQSHKFGQNGLPMPVDRLHYPLRLPAENPVPAPVFPCRSRGLSFQALRLGMEQPSFNSHMEVPPMEPSETSFEPDVAMLTGITQPAPPSRSMLASNAAQLRDLHFKWLTLVSNAGSFSSLFLGTQGTGNSEDHRVRAISKFSPATLQGYFAVWERWSSFAQFHNVSEFCPPSVLIADFLLSTAHHSVSGNALQSVKALNFMARRLELPAFLQSLHQSWIKAYQNPTHPTVRREAGPLTLSLVVWLELVILEGRFTVALRIIIGAMLLAIWGSLRWADLQWLAVDSLDFGHGILRCLAHRTKTTRRGMPIGIDALGFLGTGPNHCWVQNWLQLVQQAVVDTKAANPTFVVDFIIPTLTGSADRPVFHSPLSRSQGIKVLRTLWGTQLAEHGITLSSSQLTLLGVHSLKVTFLSWSRQLDAPEDLRRNQGHHRLDGARGSVALYARDDVWPCIKLQRLVQSHIRAGFRPLQPVCRGACQPVGDIPVELPPLPEVDCTMADVPMVASPDKVISEPISSASESSSDMEPVALGSSDDELIPTQSKPHARPRQLSPGHVNDLGPPDECLWLVNSQSMVAHLAFPCDDTFKHRVASTDTGQWFRFACGARLSLTDDAVELTDSVPQNVRICSRFGCRKVASF